MLEYLRKWRCSVLLAQVGGWMVVNHHSLNVHQVLKIRISSSDSFFERDVCTMFDYHVALWALDSTSIAKHHTFCVNYSNIYWHHSKWHYKAYLRGNCMLVTQWNISILWRSCPRLGQELAIYFDDLRSVYPPPKKLGIDEEVKGHLLFVSRVDQLIFRKSNRGVLKIYEVQ